MWVWAKKWWCPHYRSIHGWSWKQVVRGNSFSRQSLGWYTWSSTLLEKTYSRRNIVRLSTRKSKEKLCGWIWGVGKSVKILVLPVTTNHEEYTSTDVEQIDWMTPTGDIKEPLSPEPEQWTHECHSGRDSGYTTAPKNGFPLTKADLTVTGATYVTCQEQRPIRSLWYGINPRRKQMVIS